MRRESAGQEGRMLDRILAADTLVKYRRFYIFLEYWLLTLLARPCPNETKPNILEIDFPSISMRGCSFLTSRFESLVGRPHKRVQTSTGVCCVLRRCVGQGPFCSKTSSGTGVSPYRGAGLRVTAV